MCVVPYWRNTIGPVIQNDTQDVAIKYFNSELQLFDKNLEKKKEKNIRAPDY